MVPKKAIHGSHKILYFLTTNRLHPSINDVSGLQSGRRELNPGPLAPHASALAGLRHAPSGRRYYSRD